MTSRKPVRTQSLVFTLFGDYIFPRDGWAWTRSLIKILGLFGVSDQATRSTLSRMSRRGWLRPKRRGRNSLYGLTRKGERLLEEGTQRIFEPRGLDWDGEWRVVVYSLPERKRGMREALRRRLSWLGFGPLAPGTWVSPHDRHPELETLLEDLGARKYVQCFVGRWLDPLTNKELVNRCWNLNLLQRQYASFLKRWKPELERFLEQISRGGWLKPSDCFVQRFWIIHDYSAFPSRDPNLPVPLLPEGWLGNEASRVFRQFREALTAPANAFIEEALGEESCH